MIGRRWLLLFAALLLGACAQQGDPDPGERLTDAPKYGKFIWHDLLTDDVAAAKAFYGPLFGWQFEDATRPSGGPYTLIRSSEGQYVGGIIEVRDPANGSDYSRWLGYYAVPSVDVAAGAFKAAGGEVLLHARDIGTLGRGAVVRDPDGAVVGLLTSKIGYPIDELVPDRGTVITNELVTANPQEAATLYAEVSYGEVRETERDGVPRFVIQNEGRERVTVLHRPDERVEPLWLTFFAVSDADRLAGEASRLGGEVVIAPDATIRDGALALVTDPNGAVLGLLENR